MKVNKKVANISAFLIILILTTAIILANQKSSDTNRNLLSYWWYHSVSIPCKIQKQEFRRYEEKQYDKQCINKKCNEKYPERDPSGRISFAGIFCESNQRPEDVDIYNSCQTGVVQKNDPVYPEENGSLRKDYFLGIPILKESCPNGYLAE